MKVFSKEIRLFEIGPYSIFRLFTFILVVQNFYTVRGLCEFPASPMKYPNGTLVYCNPDPEKYDGNSYYMQYMLLCPDRTSCEYIWAGLFVCCIPPDKHIQRKPGMVPLLNTILDSEAKSLLPLVHILSTTVASPASAATSQSTATILSTHPSTARSTTSASTTTTATATTTVTSGQSSSGTVNSKIVPAVTTTRSTIAPINSAPDGRMHPFEFGSSFEVTAASSTMSTSRPAFSFATQSSQKRDETNPGFTRTWVVDIPDQHLKPSKLEIQRPSEVQTKDQGPLGAVPSGYTGIVHWPTASTKDPLKFQNQILQDSLSTIATNSNSNFEIAANSTSDTNVLVSKPQKSRDAKNLDEKHRQTLVSSVPLTLNDLTPETIGVLPQTRQPNKNKLHFHDFKVITIQCVLLNTDNNVQAYSRPNNDNDDNKDYDAVVNHPLPDNDAALTDTLNEFYSNNIPICPEGVDYGDDLSKNNIHDER